MSTTAQRKRKRTILQGWAPEEKVATVEMWCRIAGITVSSFVRQCVVTEAEKNIVQHVVKQGAD